MLGGGAFPPLPHGLGIRGAELPRAGAALPRSPGPRGRGRPQADPGLGENTVTRLGQRTAGRVRRRQGLWAGTIWGSQEAGGPFGSRPSGGSGNTGRVPVGLHPAFEAALPRAPPGAIYGAFGHVTGV